jgi:hypothetical protein
VEHVSFFGTCIIFQKFWNLPRFWGLEQKKKKTKENLKTKTKIIFSSSVLVS